MPLRSLWILLCRQPYILLRSCIDVAYLTPIIINNNPLTNCHSSLQPFLAMTILNQFFFAVPLVSILNLLYDRCCFLSVTPTRSGKIVTQTARPMQRMACDHDMIIIITSQKSPKVIIVIFQTSLPRRRHHHHHHHYQRHTSDIIIHNQANILPCNLI